MEKLDLRKGDRLQKTSRVAQVFARLIKKHAEKDVHWTGEQYEPEICERYVQQCAYEELTECEQLDDLFHELKDQIFDQVRYEKRQALIEAKQEQDYQAAHMPTSLG